MEDLRRFILNLPQIVPESECLECKICCRFPDTENVQTPFWSGLETNWAKRDNPGSGSWFKPEPASPSLSPRLVACGGSGYRCPAFEQETHRCRIHAVKPLDCRLYPFVLASNPGQTEVLLAMDTKCPFIERHPEDPALVAYATKLVEHLDTEAGLEYLRTNPKVVGPAWPEYLWMGALPRATGWIQAPLDKGSGCPTGQGEPERKPPHPSLRPFQEEDLPALKRALRARPRSASHYTLASLIGWSDLIRLWCAPLKEGGMALFSEQAGGLFLPVPPLADPEGEGPVREAWEILEQANQGSAVSRIEGIEAAAVGGFKEMGFSIRRAETEYLYETAGLARLSGDGYRSQRWAVNRCLKSIPVRIRKFEQGDVVACLQLYTRWAIRRQKAASDDLEKRLLRDSLFYHRRLMMDRDRLGLWGRVLESEGKILAYTFGGEISAETFGLFAEIADREVPGLAQTLFREFCREIEKSGFRRVNAMGDAGLPALRQAKMAYRPSALLPVFTATKE